MLKELTFKEKLTLRILSSLSSHPLYGYLEELIFRVDPKKAIS